MANILQGPRIKRWAVQGLAVAAFVCGALLVPGPAQAQGRKGKQNPAQLRENAKEEAIDQVASQAFKQADRNHNGLLSKSEVAAADELVQSGILSLVQQGVLGVPQRQRGKQQAQVHAPNGAAVFGPPPSGTKAKGTSVAEFKVHVQGLAQQADANYAQLRAAQMQAARRRGVRWGAQFGQNLPQQPAP